MSDLSGRPFPGASATFDVTPQKVDTAPPAAQIGTSAVTYTEGLRYVTVSYYDDCGIDFTTIGRSRTLADPTDSTHTVYAVAAELLDAHLPPGMLVRLLGVRIDQLSRGAVAEQLTFDGADGAGMRAHWSDAERAADAARSRFGSAAVRPATLLDTPGPAGGGRSQLSPESGNEIG